MCECVLARFGRIVLSATLALATSVFATKAQTADLTWGGLYRVEAVKIKNSELSGDDSNKAYLLHHLVLSPKIIAADGLTIYSRFDIFNNSAFGTYTNQAGEVFGRGLGSSTPSNETNSNVLSRTGRAGDLAVTTLYASWVQEFGQLVAGRAPMQFGLGTAYSAGNGIFDHYIDTRDLLGYKFVVGNLFFMPMLAKLNEGNVGEEDDVNDYILHVQYDNPDTELSLGLLYQMRVWTFAGNDLPTTNDALGGGAATRADGGKTTLVGLYSSQKAGDFTIAVEANLLSGDVGLRNTGGTGVSYDSFGIAGELLWNPTGGKTKGSFKLGVASGDDPGTTEVNEGYIFNRNYDVAMLMFNHPLGQANILRTGLTRDVTTKASNQIDTEAISNVVYFAPSFQTQWKENLSWGGTFVYGMLNKDPIQGSSTATDLGFEIDLNLTYKPYERLTWVTEAGLLFPGDAWKGGSTGLDNKFGYGVITKAAIAF